MKTLSSWKLLLKHNYMKNQSDIKNLFQDIIALLFYAKNIILKNNNIVDNETQEVYFPYLRYLIYQSIQILSSKNMIYLGSFYICQKCKTSFNLLLCNIFQDTWIETYFGSWPHTLPEVRLFKAAAWVLFSHFSHLENNSFYKKKNNFNKIV